MTVYRQSSTHASYSLDPLETGKRRLRNRCLFYLLTPSLAGRETLELCVDHFARADNMTDMVAALSALTHIPSEQREGAFEAFYRKWKNDALVMDKWLALQAISTAPGTLENVEKLLDSEVFSLSNPNKVRALIGTFCQRNHFRFHDESGAGYRFLCRQVLAIDSINPQVAAKLMTPFVSLAKYTQRLQVMMAEQVHFIRNREGISRDVYEIAEKCLLREK